MTMLDKCTYYLVGHSLLKRKRSVLLQSDKLMRVLSSVLKPSELSTVLFTLTVTF